MRQEYLLEQAVERIQGGIKNIYSGNFVSACAELNCALDTIGVFEDTFQDVGKHLTWMLADIDYKNQQSGAHIEDSPEVAEAREFLENLR